MKTTSIQLIFITHPIKCLKSVFFTMFYFILLISSICAYSQTWININSPSNTGVYTHFISENIGWVTTSDYFPVSNYGKIYATTDGGINWFEQSIPLQSYYCRIIRGMSFIDSLTGIVLCSYYTTNGTHLSSILWTNDGGNTWENKYYSASSSEYLFDPFFINSQTAYINSSGNTLLKTTDGGNTWNYINTPDYYIKANIFIIKKYQILIQKNME